MNFKLRLILLLVLSLAGCKKEREIPKSGDLTTMMKLVNDNSLSVNVRIYPTLDDYVASTNAVFSDQLAPFARTEVRVEPGRRYYFDVYDDKGEIDNWKSSNYITNYQQAIAPIMFLPYMEGEGDNTYIIPAGGVEITSFGLRKLYLNDNAPYTVWKPVMKQDEMGGSWHAGAPLTDKEKFMTVKLTKDFKADISSLDVIGLMNYNTDEMEDGYYYSFIYNDIGKLHGKIDFRKGPGQGYMTDTCYYSYGEKMAEVRYVMVRQ